MTFIDIPLAKKEVWNSRSIAVALFGTDVSANIKRTERWLFEKELNFPILTETNIVDEYGRDVKTLVTEQIIKNGRKQRKTILFLALYSDGSGSTILFANDGRKGRRWIFFDTVKFNECDLEKALTLLCTSEAKDILILPSGSVVAMCRVLVRKWKRNEFRLTSERKLRIGLEIYSHSYDDINAYFDPQLRQKPSPAITHLDRLEAESIHIMREVVAEASNPVMLYSIGKDSQVMLRLAQKAFYPNKCPFPLLHIDTRWKFQAMYDFRDYMTKKSNMDLIVHVNPEGVNKDINPFEHGSELHTNIMKTDALKQALDYYHFDVAFGGARRDEEKSRAKERVCSFRSKTHVWDPKNQRPELWSQYNLRKNPGETIRVFPLSNWTELDIWQYIYREQIPIVPLYFAAERPIVTRDGTLIMVDDNRLRLYKDEEIQIKKVRFRTLGCYPLTGAVESVADDLASIILELLTAKTSERQGRAIDRDTSSSMEKKKREGYF
ncbi:sulfate adenylyltransferase subunit CysD [Alphaproteobacteria bacterium]|nr:sulfate adenylyltransferase subunit CysD [Alphaproteobacteria bacterium]